MTRPLNRRTTLASLAALLSPNSLFAAAIETRAETRTPHLSLIGETTLPHRLTFKDTTVGGLSALDYDPVDDLWYALSDDRSDINPARFYTFTLALSASSPDQGMARPALKDVVFLRQADGSTYPSRKHGGNTPNGPKGPIPDPEGLRFRPQTRTLLWSSEGDVKLGLDPFVREISLDGKHLREFETPSHLKSSTALPKIGPRDNLGLEGLAISPDGTHVWAAMEGPLHQDGPLPTVSAPGGPCRFTCFNATTGKPVRQIAYQPDAIPLAPLIPGTYADNGVSEILMQTDKLMLVLERSYSLGAGNSLRLYRINVDDASNTLDEATLRPGGYQPAHKTLVANFSQMGLKKLDNTEGLAWGPNRQGQLPGPVKRTLVCISDDNFNPAQITQIAAFEFID